MYSDPAKPEGSSHDPPQCTRDPNQLARSITAVALGKESDAARVVENGAHQRSARYR
jgi:hypothetical protein